MKHVTIARGLALFVLATSPAFAQDTSPLPIQAVQQTAAPKFFLPANTEVLLRMNQEITTKGKAWDEGDTFDMSVVHDVMLGDYVVIPKGSKGAFGKSGKMDIELEYIEVGGRRIDVNGTYRQEGEGNTVATVGGVILAGVFAGFITGKSGRIPQGRELVAHTESDIAVALPAGATVPSVDAPLQAKAMGPSAIPASADDAPESNLASVGAEATMTPASLSVDESASDGSGD